MRALILLLFMSAFVGLGVIAGELYQWTDENGVTHLADTLDDIPAKYRDQCKTSVTPASVPKPAAAVVPATAPVAPAPAPAAPAPASGFKTFEVPYENEGSNRRVIIPVTFNDSTTVPMALDTGSPGLVICFELALKLGLFSKGYGNLIVATGGVGGVAAAISTITDSISVEGARDVFVPTTVTSRLSPKFEGLIGMDFLSGYTVSIDTTRQVVVFQEKPANPDWHGGHDEAWWRKTFKDFRETRDRWQGQLDALDPNLLYKPTLLVYEAQEAQQLLLKLHQHASDVGVPQDWR